MRSFSDKGFSLIETLVAVSVLLVSIAGPMTIATKGYGSALYARDQIVAFYLAGEAVEYVRNVRDTNILNGASWLDGLSSCMDGRTCSIDVRNASIAECVGGCSPLLYDEATGFYGASAGDPSPFTRSVAIAAVASDEVSITVTISWRTGVLPRTFTVREFMLNWQ